MATAAEIENKTMELLSRDESKRTFVHLLFQGLGPEELSILAQQVLSPLPEITESDSKFNNRIGVRKYSNDERIALEIASLLQFFAYRRRILQDALSASQVAEMMGISRQTPHDRAKAGVLLGVLDNNVLKFPAWQFDATGPNGVVQGLPEVLSTLKCSSFAKMSWLASPNDIFDGLKPIEVLKMGRTAEVLHEAQAVGVN